jgi:hypothetical protein
MALVTCGVAWGAMGLASRAPLGALWGVGLKLLAYNLILPGGFLAHSWVPNRDQEPHMFLMGLLFSFVIYAALIYFVLRGFARRAHRREAAEAVFLQVGSQRIAKRVSKRPGPRTAEAMETV